MTALVLHGAMAQRYGARFEWSFKTPQRALQLFFANFPEARQWVEGKHFRAVRLRNGRELDLSGQMFGVQMSDAELHLVPVAGMSGKSTAASVGKIIAGVALVAIAIWQPEFLFAADGLIGGGSAAAFSVGVFGASMAFAGISGLMTPTPKTTDPNYTFGSGDTANLSEQGVAVPVAYGRCMCGTVVVSSSLDSESFATNTDPDAAIVQIQELFNSQFKG